MARLIKDTFAAMSQIVLIDPASTGQCVRLGEALYAKLNAMPMLFGVVLKILTLIFFTAAICWGGLFTHLNKECQRSYCKAWGNSPIGLLRSYMGFCTQLLNFIRVSDEQDKL